MRGPLSVFIDDGTGFRNVTRHTTGLRFKRSAYGGDIDCTLTITVPRNTFRDLGAGDRIRIDDTRTGATVFEGTTDNPGRTDGPAGQSYEIQGFGGSARLQAMRKALGYVLIDAGLWQRAGMNSTKQAQTQQDEDNGENPTLEVSFAAKSDVDPNDQGEWQLRALKRTGQSIGRIRAQIDAGVNTSSYQMQIRTGNNADSVGLRVGKDASTNASFLVATRGGSDDIPVGDQIAALRVVRNDSQRQATKADWFRFADTRVRSALRDKFGDRLNDPWFYSDNTVTADLVIADMIGRGMLPKVDPNKVTIAEADYFDIDALAWLDGITMGDALRELLNFEPDLFWMVYDDTAEFGIWDHDKPRYWITKRDGGITHPGEELTLCNRVLVSYTDRHGKDRTLEVTAYVAELGGDPAGEFTGYIRDAEPVQLPAGFGSEANAQRAGEQALARANNPPRAGTAVIRRPIRDRWLGVDVSPHQIMPGCVVVEQETGDDFRLTEVEYDDANGTATLTIGEPVRDEAQVLARLHRIVRRRK